MDTIMADLTRRIPGLRFQINLTGELPNYWTKEDFRTAIMNEMPKMGKKALVDRIEVMHQGVTLRAAKSSRGHGWFRTIRRAGNFLSLVRLSGPGVAR